MRNRESDPNLGRAGMCPSLEVLKDRSCPSTIVLQGHTLLITGNATSDVITVRDDGRGLGSQSSVGGDCDRRQQRMLEFRSFDRELVGLFRSDRRGQGVVGGGHRLVVLAPEGNAGCSPREEAKNLERFRVGAHA